MSTMTIAPHQTHSVGPSRINEASNAPAQVESTSNSTMQSTASKTSLLWDIISLIIFPIALIRFAISIFSKSSCTSLSTQENTIEKFQQPDSLEDLNALANGASLALTQKKETITFEVSTSINDLIEADTTRKVIKIHPFCFINPLSDLQQIYSLDFSVDEKGRYKHIKSDELVKWCREKWSCPTFQLRDLNRKTIQLSELMWKRPELAKRAINNLIIREVILLKKTSQLRISQIVDIFKEIINPIGLVLEMGIGRLLTGSWKMALIQKGIGSVIRLRMSAGNFGNLVHNKADQAAVMLTKDIEAKNFLDTCKMIVENPSVNQSQQDAFQKQQRQMHAVKKTSSVT